MWNPWIEKTKGMSDMAPDEWRGMICVESANAADNAVHLAPGAIAHIESHRPRGLNPAPKSCSTPADHQRPVGSWQHVWRLFDVKIAPPLRTGLMPKNTGVGDLHPGIRHKNPRTVLRVESLGRNHPDGLLKTLFLL